MHVKCHKNIKNKRHICPQVWPKHLELDVFESVLGSEHAYQLDRCITARVGNSSEVITRKAQCLLEEREML